MLCVEFFLTNDGELLVNELAPRPHNSGHLTFDACVTSQFEQQLRAVCGLPLGSTELLRPAAMANLLGDLWQPTASPTGPPRCACPDVKLHLYGKTTPPRPQDGPPDRAGRHARTGGAATSLRTHGTLTRKDDPRMNRRQFLAATAASAAAVSALAVPPRPPPRRR